MKFRDLPDGAKFKFHRETECWYVKVDEWSYEKYSIDGETGRVVLRAMIPITTQSIEKDIIYLSRIQMRERQAKYGDFDLRVLC